MKALQALPEGYREILSIDLQKDKKLAVWVNILALIIAVIFAVPANLFISIGTLFDMSQGLLLYLLRAVILLVGMVAYVILHELVHGIAMKLCGTKKIKYGFTGFYAFAGSDDYYDKKSYLTIALAPIVIWGIVLAVMNIFVSSDWFWTVYFIQLVNLSGAAGDLYVTFKFLRLPKNILIHDHGTGMTVYSMQK